MSVLMIGFGLSPQLEKGSPFRNLCHSSPFFGSSMSQIAARTVKPRLNTSALTL